MTPDEITLVNAYIAHVHERLGDMGYRLTFSSDAAEFAYFLKAQPDSHGVSTIHDPMVSVITPDLFHWAQIWSGAEIIACHAIKLHKTRNLIDDIVTHRLFEGIPVRDYIQDVGLYPTIHDIDISGRIAIGGGLYVRPDHRGKGLNGVINLVCRAVGLPRLDFDHYIALVRQARREAAETASYGAQARYIDLSSGFYPPYGRPLDVALAHSTRAETLRILRHALETGGNQGPGGIEDAFGI